MSLSLRSIGIGAVLLLVSSAAVAQTAAPSAPPARVLFVTPEQLVMSSVLPSPPANDSWKTLGELADLHRLQDTRTPAEVAQAQADDAEESIFIFAGVLGPKFNRASLPKTALLSDHVKGNEGVIVNAAKKHFHRPRPYHLDPTLHPVCKTTENRANYAYPSGHGSVGYLTALVLAQIVPEKRDAILARADEYAHNREVCGVHYSSDESASRAVAYAMFGLLMNHPQFKAELEAATAELRSVLELGSRSAAAVRQ
jgi:acid phosphatase (class A)